jgi:hypothetical protein
MMVSRTSPGVWLTNRDLYPEEPEALAWAAALLKERLENNLKDHPHTRRCLPGSPPVDGQAPSVYGEICYYTHAARGS